MPRARAFLDSVLGHGHPCRDVARLLISELVTNAIQHSKSRGQGDSVSVLILDLAGDIRVEVSDGGMARAGHCIASVPQARGGELTTDGRGLFLVEALAADWGCQCDTTGNTVWFTVAAHEGC